MACDRGVFVETLVCKHRPQLTSADIKRYHPGMAMTLRLNEADAAALRAAAEHQGRSMHEVVVTALREYLTRRDEFRAQQVDRFLEEDAELLELLSK